MLYMPLAPKKRHQISNLSDNMALKETLLENFESLRQGIVYCLIIPPLDSSWKWIFRAEAYHS